MASIEYAGEGPESIWGSGAYRIVCAQCGTVAVYAGKEFARVESMRHARWHESQES